MASSPRPAQPEREAPANIPLAHQVDIVWGAPSDEMIEAEARGEIILVEDIYRSSTPATASKPETSGN